MKRLDYDRISGRYDRARSFGPELIAGLRAILPADFDPRSILDAGCGTGNATACLREAWPGAIVTGTDLSAGMLRRAAGKLRGVRLARGNAARLPFAPGAFGMVFSAYLLHHLDRAEDFYAEVARVLASGGKLVILTASHAQIRAHFLNEFFPRFPEIDCARFPTIAEAKRGLAAASLRPAAEREMVVADCAVDGNYLKRVGDRHISTFELMSEEDFSAGLARLTAWVSEREKEKKEMPRHRARGTLLLAEKSSAAGRPRAEAYRPGPCRSAPPSSPAAGAGSASSGSSSRPAL